LLKPLHAGGKRKQVKRCGAVRYRGSDATDIWFVESEAHLAFSANIRVPQAIDPARVGLVRRRLVGLSGNRWLRHPSRR
jgi:hypothetical protein